MFYSSLSKVNSPGQQDPMPSNGRHLLENEVSNSSKLSFQDKGCMKYFKRNFRFMLNIQ